MNEKGYHYEIYLDRVLLGNLFAVASRKDNGRLLGLALRNPALESRCSGLLARLGSTLVDLHGCALWLANTAQSHCC